MIRLRPEHYDNYSSIKMEGLLYKFGCTIDVAKSLLQKAKSLDLNVIGVRYVMRLWFVNNSCTSQPMNILRIGNLPKKW